MKTKAQIENEKQAAAQAALRFVRSGMTLGLGSGSTAGYFIELLGERLSGGELTITAVPSSLESAVRAKQAGIPLVAPKRGMRLDLTIDGADEIAPDLSLIKGAGGALLREKVLAYASHHFLVIADSSKPVRQLGRVPVPVEVVPFAMPWVADQIAGIGAEPVLRLIGPTLEKSTPDKPFLTDQQNFVLDCHFEDLHDPHAVAARLEKIPGIVGHGLFLDCAYAALVADGADVVVHRPGLPPCSVADSYLLGLTK